MLTNIAIGIVLLIILNWYLSMMSFDGYLGKLISLILLVMIASRSTLLGIIGVVIIIKKHGLPTESMTNSGSETQQSARKADFKKKYCKKGKLLKNNKEISMDDLASAFPNVEFSEEKCNPCNNSCNFFINSNDEKISDEEKLRPRNSKESFVSR